MRQCARKLDARLHGTLPERLSVGIGIHTGVATVGRLGRKKMLDYTAVGSAVNLASRLQSLAFGNAVLASSATYAPIAEDVVLRHERREVVRGLAHPVTLAEILWVQPG